MTTTATVEPELSEITGRRHTRWVLYLTMLVSGVVCLVSSAVLAVDAVVLAANPAANLSCNVSAVLSCGAVGQSWQANVFGFPNAFIGLATEPVVITIAVAGLAGTRFPRWFMFAAQVGYTLGLVFAYWLFVQSMFVIGALCPWCLTITVFTTVTFFTMLHINVVEDNLYLPARAREHARSLVRSGADYLVPTILVALIVLGILLKYGVRLLA